MEAVVQPTIIEGIAAPQHSAQRPWAVQAIDVTLSFGGQRILDNVSFSLGTGAAVLLRGDNGSGKTTLLNLLSGFIAPNRGRVQLQLNGKTLDPARASAERLARAGMGRLWQDIRLFPTMTVLENVMAATAGMTGHNPALALTAWPVVRRQEKAARERALANLERVGMADRAGSSADKLSVGQMKRVALARLLQAEADLWLLDEPLAGLDRESAESLIRLLDDLNDNYGKTFLVVEHQHERLAPVCRETWYLGDGELLTVDTK